MAIDLNDPEVKAAIKAAVDEANTALEAKNREMLDELKKTKAELRAKSEIKPEDVAALEKELEEAKGKLTAAEKAAADAKKAADTATKALEAETGVTHRLVAENGLVSALSKAGITDPAFLEAVKAMHLGSVKVVSEGDARKAMYGDKDLEAAIIEWAASDVGKKFVTAPANGGGGAGGGSRDGTGGKQVARAEFEKMDPASKASFMKDGGKVVDQAA